MRLVRPLAFSFACSHSLSSSLLNILSKPLLVRSAEALWQVRGATVQYVAFGFSRALPETLRARESERDAERGRKHGLPYRPEWRRHETEWLIASLLSIPPGQELLWLLNIPRTQAFMAKLSFIPPTVLVSMFVSMTYVRSRRFSIPMDSCGTFTFSCLFVQINVYVTKWCFAIRALAIKSLRWNARRLYRSSDETCQAPKSSGRKLC